MDQKGPGSYEFGWMTFTQEHVGKTYVYTVKEVAGSDSRYDYDEEIYTLTIKVSNNENLGMNTLVHGSVGEGVHITAKLRGWSDNKVGDLVPVHFNRMHFFDPETTNAIRKEAE